MAHNVPEPGLEPPEPEIIGTCPVCGMDLYQGQEAWRKGYEMICESHMDLDMAIWLGWSREETKWNG